MPGLSKADMEEMWKSGPVGVLKSHLRYQKKYKLYTVQLTPYKTEITRFKDHAQIHKIYAVKEADAILSAKSKFYSNVHKELSFSSIEVKVLP